MQEYAYLGASLLHEDQPLATILPVNLLMWEPKSM